MYSLMLAAALTTSTATPDCCWWGGCGYYGYYGWYPGWYGSPGWYGYPGYYAWPYACAPVVTSAAPASTGESAQTAREKDLEKQIKELREEIRKLKAGKENQDEVAAPAPAHVVVKLPEDARLFVNDDPCPLTSATRAFDTPELKAGQPYHYTLRAEATRGGRVVSESKRVDVRAGQETVVEFGEMRGAQAANR